jgi:hypothetical protein
VFAQSNEEWSKIGLSASGKNIQNGVEAFYKTAICSEEKVVLIKFVNHNSFAVKAEWDEAIFTNEMIWYTRSSDNSKKMITIGVNETIYGDCSDESKKILVVRISDFIKTSDNFKLFGIKSFKVTGNK